MNNNTHARSKLYQLPNEIRNIAAAYGLCIFNYSRAMVSPPMGYYYRPERYFEYYSISHLLKGFGKLWMPNTPERRIRPGDCVIMPPDQIHKYGAAEDIYCEDHLCFAGVIADRMFKSGIIQTGIFNFGTVRRLLPIMEAASSPSVDSQFDANLRLQRLLLELHIENRNISSGHMELIDRLIKEIEKNISHWWTVAEMSEYCQIGEDMLRKLFIQRTGTLPKQYIDNLRMRMAATMLTERQQTVKETAQMLGYRDRFHFSRRFKAITGISPQNYRKQFAKDDATSIHTPDTHPADAAVEHQP